MFVLLHQIPEESDERQFANGGKNYRKNIMKIQWILSKENGGNERTKGA